MFNKRGTFESDLTIIRIAPDEFLAITGTAQVVRDQAWIRRQIRPGENVALVDITAASAVLGVMGPSARELLQPLTDSDLSREAFPFGTSRIIGIGHATCRALRLTYVGELGWELHVPADQATVLYEAIWQAGPQRGLVNAGHYAINSLRLEKGYRAWGREVGPDETPREAGLEFAVKLDKPGGFIGREALLARQAERPAKRLVIFTLEDTDALPWGDEPILRDGQLVGWVTSAGFGHTLGRAVAMGYVRHAGGVDAAFIESGAYEIEIAGERMPARAHLRAPYDPTSARVRA